MVIFLLVFLGQFKLQIVLSALQDEKYAEQIDNILYFAIITRNCIHCAFYFLDFV